MTVVKTTKDPCRVFDFSTWQFMDFDSLGEFFTFLNDKGLMAYNTLRGGIPSHLSKSQKECLNGRPLLVAYRYLFVADDVVEPPTRDDFMKLTTVGSGPMTLVNQITGERWTTSKEIKDHIAKDLKANFSHFKYCAWVDIGYCPVDGYYYGPALDSRPVPVYDAKKNKAAATWVKGLKPLLPYDTFMYRVKLGTIVKPTL